MNDKKPTNHQLISSLSGLIIGVILLVVTTGFSSVTETDRSVFGIKNFETRERDPSVFGSETADDVQKSINKRIDDTKTEVRRQICDHAPTDEPCATIPNDNLDFSELFVYLFINATAQDSFDIFSWQSFIGMNWPVDENDRALNKLADTGADYAPAWSRYVTPQELFDPEYKDNICPQPANGESDAMVLKTDTFIQTSGLPLIDNNLNYVVYDVRISDELANYIADNGLDTVQGQVAFKDSGKEIDFPLGHYDDPEQKTGGSMGSAAIKTAWKIFDPNSEYDPGSYYRVKGRIPVAAKYSETGRSFCLDVELGLVGMHIMRRTKSGNGRQWIWSTFEHVNNSPIAGNSRNVVDTLHETLFEGGCSAPEHVDRSYAFFNPSCKNCPTNMINSAEWKWSPQIPYAKSHAVNGQYGTQVVRCWRIFEGTELINNIWQEKLKGTVWANYQLFSAQWKGGNQGVMFPQGEVPRFLINTTMETYDQFSDNSSCLSCHSDAKSLAGQDAAFSFLPSMAARFQPE